jgi:hypothetical protein
MASSSRSLWRCSTCTFAENKLASTACAMCGAIVHDKGPASLCLGAGVAAVRPKKLLRETAEEDTTKKKPPPLDVAIAKEPHHPSGVVIEIVGTECGNQGRSCEKHLNCGEVMAEDVVVRLWKVQILVKGKEETAIAAIWVNDGIDRCRVGFLPRHMVKHAARFNGALAQCVCVFLGDANVCDTAERRAFHRNHGCCLAAIIAWPSHIN